MTKCKYCGKDTINDGTQLCNCCWEVDTRIDDFVKTDGGKERVLAAILKLRRERGSSDNSENE